MAIVFILFQIHYMAHQALFITALLSAGYDITVAGAISSITYVGITVGQIAFPIVSDRCARKNVLGSLMVLSGLSYMALSLLLRTSISIEAVFVLVAVTGAMLAANANMQATMTELFPPDLRGAGPGFINTLGMIGKFAGPVLAGAMVAATGGDMLNYMFVGGPAALAAGIIALVFLPKTSGKYGDPVAVEYAKKMEEKEKANATSLSYDNEITA
jgi:sugar phosphate permease